MQWSNHLETFLVQMFGPEKSPPLGTNEAEQRPDNNQSSGWSPSFVGEEPPF
jgi:hypothetical protein